MNAAAVTPASGASTVRGSRARRIAIGLYVVSRLYVAFVVHDYISDVFAYRDWADAGMQQGKTAYVDFHFPYPPLALPLMYAPSLVSAEFVAYRRVLHLELWMLEAVTLLLLLRFARSRLGVDMRGEATVVGIVTLFGSLQAHLLYDRYDVAVALVCVALLVASSREGYRTVWLGMLGCVGFYLKLWPVALLAPALVFAAMAASDTARSMVRRAAGGVLAACVPLVIVGAACAVRWGGAVVENVSDHAKRGIQIESLWATPWMIAKTMSGAVVTVGTSFSAEHLEGIGEGYVLISKTMGLALLVVLSIALFVAGMRRVQRAGRVDVPPMLVVKTFTCAILVILATQRVLSPQYFIWLIPFFALWIAQTRSRWLFAAVAVLYVLTYIGFDKGYWQYMRGEVFFVWIVAARNAWLLGLAVWCVREVVRDEFFRAGSAPVRSALPAQRR